MSHPAGFTIATNLGAIRLKFLNGAAPQTVAHVSKLIETGLFSTGKSTFYRSDFVIQVRSDQGAKDIVASLVAVSFRRYRFLFASNALIPSSQTGLYGTDVQNPVPDLPVNETPLHEKVTNDRGAMAIAHFDVPDNGNSEMFISLQHNEHLDAAYGGYCVFARVEDDER